MSWYDEKLSILIQEQEKNMNSPFVKNHNNNIESVVFILTNMQTDEDFIKIKEEFMEVNGVMEVKRHLMKKVEVIYDNKKVRLEGLTIALRKTGYKYLNRACKNCMQK